MGIPAAVINAGLKFMQKQIEMAFQVSLLVLCSRVLLLVIAASLRPSAGFAKSARHCGLISMRPIAGLTSSARHCGLISMGPSSSRLVFMPWQCV
jgi:hypothetical protein